MKRSIILAITFVVVAIGGIALRLPILAQQPGATSSTEATPSSPMRQTNQANMPIRYLILLDVSDSMSWNLNGEGTSRNSNFNCEWAGLSNLPFYAGCSGLRTPWHVESERRIYLAKAMIGKLIDTMNTHDRMEMIAFTSGENYQGNVKVIPTNGWTADRDILKAELLTVGSYTNHPYITTGRSAQVQSIIKAQEVLANTPDSIGYRTVVVLISNGPANVFMNGMVNTGVDTCPDILSAYKQFVAHCHVGYSDTYQMERPITAMITAADTIKQRYTVDFYTISMTNNPDDIGMDAVASKPSMAYHYSSPDMLIKITAEQQ